MKAVLLDAAGTLVRLEPPGPRLRELVGQRFGVPLDAEQARIALIAEIAYYRANMLDGSNPHRLDGLRGRCAEVLRAALPRSEQVAAIPNRELVDVLVESLVFRAFGEVPEVLAELRTAGLRLVVASNWDCSLPSVLDRAGIGGLVDGVVCSAVVGVGKPDPRLLVKALEVAGVEPDEAIHVGDSLIEDVAGARAAGVRAVWLDRVGAGHGEVAPGDDDVERISSLTALPRILGL